LISNLIKPSFDVKINMKNTAFLSFLVLIVAINSAYAAENLVQSKTKPALIQNDDGEPVALIGLGEAMNGDGCTTHLGTFEVKDVAYDGVSEIVAGIRVLPLEYNALSLDKAPTLIRFSTSDLPNSSASWVPTLVKEGRKLLVAYNICGNGGYQNATSIYRLDRLNW
jgi:hypothetical protein